LGFKKREDPKKSSKKSDRETLVRHPESSPKKTADKEQSYVQQKRGTRGAANLAQTSEKVIQTAEISICELEGSNYLRSEGLSYSCRQHESLSRNGYPEDVLEGRGPRERDTRTFSRVMLYKKAGPTWKSTLPNYFKRLWKRTRLQLIRAQRLEGGIARRP